MAERAGEAPFYGARPCIPLSLENSEQGKYVPLAREGKEWSREQIIGALQRFRDHYGRPPRARDCRALHELPSPATIHRHFRSLADARGKQETIRVETLHTTWSAIMLVARDPRLRRTVQHFADHINF